eukprot:TRINITY_DN2263_c0_g3_i10.p1 TRINITY_DN2263_c0_g3~~TRINITY_DN2263_c0_g3_i10.p1  ORF type:complete len:353 (-),score=51.88 TRINITY_DN2263_c0_g3_i10:682-1740(-)
MSWNPMCRSNNASNMCLSNRGNGNRWDSIHVDEQSHFPNVTKQTNITMQSYQITILLVLFITLTVTVNAAMQSVSFTGDDRLLTTKGSSQYARFNIDTKPAQILFWFKRSNTSNEEIIMAGAQTSNGNHGYWRVGIKADNKPYTFQRGVASGKTDEWTCEATHGSSVDDTSTWHFIVSTRGPKNCGIFVDSGSSVTTAQTNNGWNNYDLNWTKKGRPLDIYLGEQSDNTQGFNGKLAFFGFQRAYLPDWMWEWKHNKTYFQFSANSGNHCFYDFNEGSFPVDTFSGHGTSIVVTLMIQTHSSLFSVLTNTTALQQSNFSSSFPPFPLLFLTLSSQRMHANQSEPRHLHLLCC